MNDTITLRYTKFSRLLTFHLQSVSFPCRKMAFSDDDKAVIKNGYVEKGTMKRRPGSGKPRSAITPENLLTRGITRNPHVTQGN